MEAQVVKLSRLIQKYILYRIDGKSEEAEKLMLNIPPELHKTVITCAFNLVESELPMHYSIMISECKSIC